MLSARCLVLGASVLGASVHPAPSTQHPAPARRRARDHADPLHVAPAALFMIGVIGVMVRRNIIIIFMSIELILNAVNINLIAFSAQLHDAIGQVFAIFVIAVAAAEAAVGLGIILGLLPQQGNRQYRRNESDAMVEAGWAGEGGQAGGFRNPPALLCPTCLTSPS